MASQDTLTGAVADAHPLLPAYKRIHRHCHDEPPTAKLLHLRWLEFAPPPQTADGERGEGEGGGGEQGGGSGDFEAAVWSAARGGSREGSLGGTVLVDLVTGQVGRSDCC